MAKDLFKRASRADVRKANVLSLFRTAANELEAAAKAHREIASEAAEVADSYKNRAGESVQAAVEAEQVAARLRELVA